MFSRSTAGLAGFANIEPHDLAQLDTAGRSHHNKPEMHEKSKHGHRSGFVALAGRPNVGKSTLLNALLGQPVAAVSARPQTTQRTQLGILSRDDSQIIFIDTPGIHDPLHLLGKHMNTAAEAALGDADVIAALFDAAAPPTHEDESVRDHVLRLAKKTPSLVVLNKIDLVASQDLEARTALFADLLPGELITISAKDGTRLELLVNRLVELLPEGPPYYDADEITATYERDIAADIIRAALLRVLEAEVPYAIAVRIDAYKEREDHGAYIEATLFVERESQKGIVIGKGGVRLREIGQIARSEIEAMSGRKVFLRTRVKVLKGWRNDPASLKRFGYGSKRRTG